MTENQAIDAIEQCAWPGERLAEAIETIARRSGFDFPPPVSALAPPGSLDEDNLQAWLESASGRLDLECEAVTAGYGDLESLLRRAAPALFQLPERPNQAGGFVLALGCGRKRMKLLAPDLSVRRVPIASMAERLSADVAMPVSEGLDRLLDAAEIRPERRDRARQALLREQLANHQIGGCWLLRQSPGGSFWQQLRHARVPLRLTGLITAHALQQGLQILGWFLIVQGALQGHFDRVWLMAWVLVLLTSIPFELLAIWLQSSLTVVLGTLMKKRLLLGTLNLRPEEIRHQGIGSFLGRVLEAETLETMMLGGGFAALIATIEIFAAMVILGLGAGGWAHAGLLLVWVFITSAMAWRFNRRSQQWRTGHRFLINALIERMVGHRTRLAQEDPRDWHNDEDQALAAYMQLSRSMDSSIVQLRGSVNRGWLLLGLGGLAYALVEGNGSPTLIAASIGGIMLASQGFNTMVTGLDSVIGVINAWGQIGPLFHAAARNQQRASKGAAFIASGERTAGDQPLLMARDLTFRYREHGQAVLDGCDLRIGHGERLLLEGASGGGKSTLAAILAGLRTPTSGLLLLNGLDRPTLGATAWRRQAVAAPQFHENHVLTETFAFNLLMGRRWPPTASDLQQADAICRELGLGELLDKMPAGLQQMVGESGWQLSHGERSRLYIARALLQQADFMVLDESFAALDPENLRLALRCVLQRAPTLMVIAHP